MGARLQRAEKRAYMYQDEILGYLRNHDGRRAVNAAVAHLQSALVKEARRNSGRGQRAEALVAGIVENLARAVPEADIDPGRRPSLAELLALFEKGLRDGGT